MKTWQGAEAPSIETQESYVPMLRELREAVGDLRDRLEAGLADLREQIAGKSKSHYTVDEVAGLTGRASYTVRSWITQGLIQAIRVPGTGPKGRLLIPHEELRKLVDRGLGARLPAVSVGGARGQDPAC